METVETIDKAEAPWKPQAALSIAIGLPYKAHKPRPARLDVGGARTAALCVLVAAAGFISATRAVVGDTPPVVAITGGTTDHGHNYTWTVTNRHTSPIVSITFPHYRATVFDVPDGWDRACTHLLEPGSEDLPGACTATSTAAGSPIERGASATFTMRVWQRGTQRTRGTVSIRFADGSRMDVPGVELSAREPFGDRYVSLLGLGSIFVVWLVVRSVRGRKAPRPKSPAARPAGTDG